MPSARSAQSNLIECGLTTAFPSSCPGLFELFAVFECGVAIVGRAGDRIDWVLNGDRPSALHGLVAFVDIWILTYHQPTQMINVHRIHLYYQGKIP